MTKSPSFPEMRAITLVIASQRSGSTLLCQDIASLRGMGAPKEHFLELLDKPDNILATATEADVLACISKGTTPIQPDTGAVKLMVNYAPKIDMILRGSKPVAPQEAIQNIIDWAHVRFDRVNLIALIRTNALDQAISRAMATLTDVWHRSAKKLPEGEDPYAEKKLPPKAMNMAILDNLPAVLRQTAIIREAARKNADRCLLIDYETLANSVAETSAAIIDHARKSGFEPENSVAKRDLRKLIDTTRSTEIRKDFRRFLEQRVKI